MTLFAQWKFEVSSGNIPDASGNGNDLVYTGTSYPGQIAGFEGNALEFWDVTSSCQFTCDTGLSGPSAWADEAFELIFYVYPKSGNGDFDLAIDFGGLFLDLFVDFPNTDLLVGAYAFDGDINLESLTDVPLDDGWYKITVRSTDGASMEILVNDVQVAYGAGTLGTILTGVITQYATSGDLGGESVALDEMSLYRGAAAPTPPTHSHDTELEAVALLFTASRSVGADGICIDPATGCMPETAFAKQDAPIAAFDMDEAPLAEYSRDDTPSAAMVCRIRR